LNKPRNKPTQQTATMADEGETIEIDTLNAEIADLKSTLTAIQNTEPTVASGIDAMAGYVARKGDIDGFLVQSVAAENPFHAVVKGQSAGGGSGKQEGDCCLIL
jgi:hypothetical protein